jgi:diacylglycerol kinase family enzyme
MGPIRNVMAKYPQVSHFDVYKPKDVLAAMTNFARKKVDMVVVNGGDGTAQAVLTVLFHHKPFKSFPVLVLLRGGTANMSPRDLGVKGSREKALQRVLTWAFTGVGDAVIVKRPVLRVQAGEKEPQYGLFFGAGAIYQGIQFFDKKVKNWGLRSELAQMLIMGRYLLAFAARNRNVVSPVPMTIDMDRTRLEERKYLLIIISTLERLILGLRPYWGIEDAPLQLTALTANPQHLLRTILTLAFCRKKRHQRQEYGYFSHNVHEVRLNLDTGFTLDGQLYMPEPLEGPVVVKEGGTVSFLRL